MGLMDELIESIVKHADYRYNARKEGLRKQLEGEGLKVYFTQELTSCRRKSELRHRHPELQLKLMRKPPLLLGEIVQRGVKVYLPKDVEEERMFCKVLGDTAIIGTPDFYSKFRRSVYELKFTHRKPKLYEHHRLKACIYKWLSDAEHAYLLYCSPTGFREFEVNDEFCEKDVKALMNKWSSPMWDWECKLCVYDFVYRGIPLKKTTVKVDKKLVQEAHDLGLNVSKVCENSLKQAIEQMRELYGKNKARLVRPPGFEPGLSAREAGVLDQARLRPHIFPGLFLFLRGVKVFRKCFI